MDSAQRPGVDGGGAGAGAPFNVTLYIILVAHMHTIFTRKHLMEIMGMAREKQPSSQPANDDDATTERRRGVRFSFAHAAAAAKAAAVAVAAAGLCSGRGGVAKVFEALYDSGAVYITHRRAMRESAEN